MRLIELVILLIVFTAFINIFTSISVKIIAYQKDTLEYLEKTNEVLEQLIELEKMDEGILHEKNYN